MLRGGAQNVAITFLSPQGGVGGLHGKISLTAFVTIALKQALVVYGGREPDTEKQEQLRQVVGSQETGLEAGFETWLSRFTCGNTNALGVV